MRDLSRDSTHLYVKEFTQTFLDNVVIESAQDITRRWHRPTRRLETPLISKDRPWEHVPYFTYSNYCVLRDPQDGLFKCWYEDMAGTPAPEPIPNNPFGTFSRQLYAESEDGITGRSRNWMSTNCTATRPTLSWATAILGRSTR